VGPPSKFASQEGGVERSVEALPVLLEEKMVPGHAALRQRAPLGLIFYIIRMSSFLIVGACGIPSGSFFKGLFFLGP
jgi:hypothetical protein